MPKEKKIISIKKSNLWKYSTFLLLAVIIVLLVLNFSSSGITGKTISGKDAGENLVDYFSSIGYEGFEVLGVQSVGTMYLINTNYEGEEIPFYVTKDGYIVGNSLVSVIPEDSGSNNNQQTDVIKSDKPVVELFVMSYCPYGTQAEKGIIPVVELLGDKIDFRMRFVSYLMHGKKEAEENLREYCIQEIAPEKYLDYMTCFLEGNGIESNGYISEGNDVDYCLAQAGIDKTALETCIAEADEEFSITENLNSGETYPRFNVDADLNEQYEVQGSPTLVINGQKVSSSRDPASYLSIICQAFTDAPEECSIELSSETPSPYFGWEGTGSSTNAQC